ncbi:helix-turn-helix domain-containing protein [Pedobacter jeongneungensis]|uniref:helix-turn-helix domain-containing protein n=1 Tax=Pedobacter jeongneungensis TaxID=947309 RepID=UPI00046924AD|nr:helix-turn-helix transcriptional regulator [Pedobacter jeongneungensis]
MHNKQKKIPVNTMDDFFRQGIALDRNPISKSDFTAAFQKQEATQSHRDEGYTFHILEKGSVKIEIDFKFYEVSSPAVVYLHPDQVHRMRDIEDIVVCSLSMSGEKLNTAYLDILEELSTAIPLALGAEAFTAISDCFALCLKFYHNKAARLHPLLVRDSCNVLIGLLLSEFMNQKKPQDVFSRYDKVAKSFRRLVEENYRCLKRAGEYAELLHISTPYLNECIKNVTGFTASQAIQERIMLEAKRLLYHTGKSVKEIAFDLGYTDYPYFSRLFSKTTGLSAKAFRSKNLD